MEKLLFFGLTDAEFQKIKPVASRLKLHCEQIPVSMYHNTLGVIASGRAVPAGIPAAPGTPVPASLTAALGADAPAGASAVSAACGIPEAGSTSSSKFSFVIVTTAIFCFLSVHSAGTVFCRQLL